jgi:thioredoxin reductase (NADPH)
MFTTDVENYPGFPKGVTGQEMMELFRQQAEHQGTRFITADVQRVDLSERPFKLWVGEDENELHLAQSVIIATGARANYLGLPSEDALKNRGVSACAVCDGALFRNKDVVVVGGGDTAMEEASYLAGLCSHVTLIHRRDEFRASQAMQRRVRENPKIQVLTSHVVQEVMDPALGRVTGVRVRDLKGTHTSVEGVFAAGDVADWNYRQAVTAAGTGCMAALDAERWLAVHGSH